MKITQKVLVYGLLLTSVQMAFAARDDDLSDLRQSGIAADEWQLIRNDKRHNITQYVIYHSPCYHTGYHYITPKQFESLS